MLDYELKFEDKVLIAGIDEAGRGPLAGPVVCACVVMPLDENSIIDGVNDSKKLSPKKREEFFEKIKERAIAFSIVEVDEREIDEINILNATKKGMIKSIKELGIVPEIVLIDAVELDIDLEQEAIIKGDTLSYNIACASILAKVYRDRLMVDYSKTYPEYCFDKHKGYGTKLHIEKLKEFGACPIHRSTFIKNFF